MGEESSMMSRPDSGKMIQRVALYVGRPYCDWSGGTMSEWQAWSGEFGDLPPHCFAYIYLVTMDEWIQPESKPVDGKMMQRHVLGVG